MKEEEELLSDIEKKVKKILEHNERLIKENEEMRERIFGYIEKLDDSKRRFEAFKKDVETMKIIEKSSMDNLQLKREIEHYIHKIDKCIATIQTK